MTDMTPPASVEELDLRIAERQKDLPKRLQDCASFTLRRGEDIAFLTVAQAAEEARVPASAFIRFCKALGFSGYSDLQKLFRVQATGRRPTYRHRVDHLRRSGTGTPHALLQDFAAAAGASVDRLAERLDPQRLDAALALLADADCVHVVGFRRAFSVASYIAYVLGQFEMRVVLHDRVGAIETMRRFRPGDVVLVISYEPYSTEAVALARAAAEQRVPVVALTDTALSPLVGQADVSLEVVEEEVGAFRSISATFCLASVLCVAIGARHERSILVK